MQIKSTDIKIIPIDSVVLNPKNPNKHDKKQIKHLVKVIKFQGFRNPITISNRTGFVVCGHGRLEAAKELGMTEVPAMYQHFDDEAAEYAHMVADNALQSQSVLDFKMINEEIINFGPDFDLDHLGIKNFKLDVLPEDEKERSDSVPTNAETRAKRGDVFLLGEHRLMCGDSTMIDDVEKLMQGELADMVFTDPPYNVNYDPEQRVSSFSQNRKDNPLGKIQNDKKSPEDFRKFLDDVYTSLNIVMKESAAIYICHADTEGHHFRSAFVAQPWKMQSCLIWKKSVLCFGRADYQWIHEPILYGWKEGAAHNWYGDRKQTTVFECPTDHYNKADCDTEGYVHPTQKPVALITYALNNSSKPEDIILDVFGGSGSTLIACEKTKRRARLMELDEKYVDTILKRWENFTGQKAELLGSS